MRQDHNSAVYYRGYGKLSKICRISGAKIALAAPTGMAAKRMKASTGKEAKTIHKLIEYNPVRSASLP